MMRSLRFVATLAIALLPLPVVYAETPTTKPIVKASVQNPALAGIHIERDVKYGDAPGRANLLDIYVPENASGALPLLVWIHGGGWQAGDKAGCPALGMLHRGYVVASINYRLSQEAIFPAQIQDCKAAIRWFRAHAKDYHIDPDRIGVWGASAGGHLVALLGTAGDAKELEGTGGNLEFSSKVQAVCDWFGPTDMARFFPQAGNDNIFKAAPKNSPLTALFGGALEERKELVAQANPLTFISKTTPPFLIMHGDKDKLVPVAQSQMLADALLAAGVECHLEVLPGAGHGDGFGKPEIAKMVMEFFDKHLNPNAPPVPGAAKKAS